MRETAEEASSILGSDSKVVQVQIAKGLVVRSD